MIDLGCSGTSFTSWDTNRVERALGLARKESCSKGHVIGFYPLAVKRAIYQCSMSDIERSQVEQTSNETERMVK